MNIKPLGERVIVEKFKPKETTTNGIIIPDGSRKNPNRATVISVNDKVPLNVGDIVILANWSGSEIENEDGDKLLVVKYDDIIAVEV